MSFVIPYAVGCGVTAAITNYIYNNIYGNVEDYSDEDSNSLKLDDSIQLIVTNVDNDEVSTLDVESSCTSSVSSNSNSQINLEIPDKYLSPPQDTTQPIEKKINKIEMVSNESEEKQLNSCNRLEIIKEEDGAENVIELESDDVIKSELNNVTEEIIEENSKLLNPIKKEKWLENNLNEATPLLKSFTKKDLDRIDGLSQKRKIDDISSSIDLSKELSRTIDKPRKRKRNRKRRH